MCAVSKIQRRKGYAISFPNISFTGHFQNLVSKDPIVQKKKKIFRFVRLSHGNVTADAMIRIKNE